MTWVTIVASFAAAPLLPLMRSHRGARLGILFSVGYAVVLVGLIGPLGGREAELAAFSGWVAGFGASGITMSLLQNDRVRDRDSKQPEALPPRQ